MLENLKGKTISELEALVRGMDHSAFRGRQLFLWVHQKRATDFDHMTDLSKKFREELKAKCEIRSVAVEAGQASEDGTAKYLVRLEDGETVESVYIPTEGRDTLCVSTQVGCKMACSFCATGQMGFIRNLKAWEIVDQLMQAPSPRPITNIVLMGMGEPFDNYEEMKKAIEIFRHPMGFQIGKRHITVSTVGLTPEIQRFVDEDLGKLAISLHGTTDEQRGAIMPINKRYSIAELMNTCRNLRFKGTQRVTFEYLLIDGLNDSPADARRLIALVRGIPCKINLLSYNENPFVQFKRPPEERVLEFQRILMDANLTVTYRRSRGRDVDAACGQLRTRMRDASERGRPLSNRSELAAPA